MKTTEEFAVIAKALVEACGLRIITPTELRLLQLLAKQWSDSFGDWCFLSTRQFAHQLAINDRSIRTMWSKLSSLGMIETTPTRTQIMAHRLNRSYWLAGRGGCPPNLGQTDPGPLSFYLHSSDKKAKKNSGGEFEGRPRMKGMSPIPFESESMPLIPDLVPKKKTREISPSHEALAKKLYDALKKDPTYPPKNNAWKKWGVHFYLLEHKDGIDIKRIEATIEWLTSPEQIEKTKCRSGSRFRAMFEDLETFAQGDRARKPSADAEQLTAIELRYLKSLTNFNQPISLESLPEAAIMVKQHLCRIAAICEEHQDLFKTQAGRKFTLPKILKLKETMTWYTIMEALCHRLKHWPEWNGDLRPPARNLVKSNSIELSAHFRGIDLSWSEIYDTFKEHLSAR